MWVLEGSAGKGGAKCRPWTNLRRKQTNFFFVLLYRNCAHKRRHIYDKFVPLKYEKVKFIRNSSVFVKKKISFIKHLITAFKPVCKSVFNRIHGKNVYVNKCICICNTDCAIFIFVNFWPLYSLFLQVWTNISAASHYVSMHRSMANLLFFDRVLDRAWYNYF